MFFASCLNKFKNICFKQLDLFIVAIANTPALKIASRNFDQETENIMQISM